MVFYGGNLSFCREKLVEIPVFIRWKRPFRNKQEAARLDNWETGNIAALKTHPKQSYQCT